MRYIVMILSFVQTFAQTPTFEEAAREIRAEFGLAVEVDEGLASTRTARAREKSENPFAYLQAVCKANGKANLLFDEVSNAAHVFSGDNVDKKFWNDDKVFFRIETTAPDKVDGKEHIVLVCSIAICGNSVCAIRITGFKMNGTEVAVPGDFVAVYRTKNFLTQIPLSCPVSALQAGKNELTVNIETIEGTEKTMILKDKTDVAGISFGLEVDTQVRKTGKLNIEGAEACKFINELPLERRVAMIKALSEKGDELPTIVLSATSGKKCYISFAVADGSLSETIAAVKFNLADSLQKKTRTAHISGLQIK